MSSPASVTIVGVSLVSTISKTNRIDLNSNTSFTTNGTNKVATMLFNATLYAGAYTVLVSTTPYGYIKLSNSTIYVSFPTNVAHTSGPMSFNGGTFTINASYLSPSSYLDFNGFISPLISHSPTQAIYQVHPQVTRNTQTAFNLMKNRIIDKK